jgi:hypothetical protein
MPPYLCVETTQVQPSAAEIGADRVPVIRGKQRLCSLETLDGRAHASKRANELAATPILRGDLICQAGHRAMPFLMRTLRIHPAAIAPPPAD